MDIQVDFFRWQVPDLKEYLQHRGIACYLHRKHELVKLCELAQELDLEKITSTNDYELSQVNRRTITEKGVTQVVGEIGQVPIWSSVLKLLPNIEQCDILFIK
jgi:deoxyribodipyrimidine photolyase